MKREIGLKMVAQAFEKGVQKGLISEASAKKYTGCIQNFFNHLDKVKEEASDKKSRDAYNPKFWNSKWVDAHFKDMYDRFHGNGKKPLSGSYIESTTHAFGKLQELVNQEGVWKNAGVKKVRVGLKGSIQSETGRLYQNYLEGAMSSQDEKTSMKGTDRDFKQFLVGLEKVVTKDNPNHQTVQNLVKAQYHTGGRVTAEVNLKAGDINLTAMTKKYDKDKNNFTRRVPLHNEQKLFYQNLIKGKTEGSPLFPLLDKAGKPMGKHAASKYVQEIYKKAAEAAGLVKRDENGKITSRYTSHTTRRIYAQSLYNSTRYMSTKQIDAEIKKYVDAQGANKEGIQKRLQREKKRLNYYRLKNNLRAKDLTWNQKRKLLVMLHLGHSRTDTCTKSYIVEDAPFWKKDK
ncbi:tyrosine-type recombinase/integrase [Priestia aryabhattai]|uniref:tyrosine-type recombinase/integrase n=1 Tax=Priestia aryabhattai TaxID=412384 RepID=UPI003D2DD571